MTFANDLDERLVHIALSTINSYNEGDAELYEDVLKIAFGVEHDNKSRYRKYLYFNWLLLIIKSKLFLNFIPIKNTPVEFPLERYKKNLDEYLDVNNRLSKYIKKCIDEDDYSNLDVLYLLNINLNYLLELSTEYFGYVADVVNSLSEGMLADWPNDLVRENNNSIREIENAMKTLEL